MFIFGLWKCYIKMDGTDLISVTRFLLVTTLSGLTWEFLSQEFTAWSFNFIADVSPKLETSFKSLFPQKILNLKQIRQGTGYSKYKAIKCERQTSDNSFFFFFAEKRLRADKSLSFISQLYKRKIMI